MAESALRIGAAGVAAAVPDASAAVAEPVRDNSPPHRVETSGAEGDTAAPPPPRAESCVNLALAAADAVAGVSGTACPEPPQLSAGGTRSEASLRPPDAGDEGETAEGGAGGAPAARQCSHCRTPKTPLWRNGPVGPKSL